MTGGELLKKTAYLAALQDNRPSMENLAQDCSRCFVYSTAESEVVGIPAIQSLDFVYVIDDSGMTRLIPLDDLVAIAPFSKAVAKSRQQGELKQNQFSRIKIIDKP